MDKKEYNRQYYQKNKNRLLELNKQYQQEHKDEYNKYKKHYYQEHKEGIAEYNKQYQQEHKEEKTEYNKQYYQDNAEIIKQYRQTPIGRARSLVAGHKRADKKYNRGECTLTPEWVVENIFSQPCHYCGETDWREIGCDRIDNDKPHTPENVVPCCDACNKKRGTKSYDYYKKNSLIQK